MFSNQYKMWSNTDLLDDGQTNSKKVVLLWDQLKVSLQLRITLMRIVKAT